MVKRQKRQHLDTDDPHLTAEQLFFSSRTHQARAVPPVCVSSGGLWARSEAAPWSSAAFAIRINGSDTLWPRIDPAASPAVSHQTARRSRPMI